MFLQLHHVLNSVRVSFQRSLPESWAESWLFAYWSCETAREAAHEAVPNGPLITLGSITAHLSFFFILKIRSSKWHDHFSTAMLSFSNSTHSGLCNQTPRHARRVQNSHCHTMFTSNISLNCRYCTSMQSKLWECRSIQAALTAMHKYIIADRHADDMQYLTKLRCMATQPSNAKYFWVHTLCVTILSSYSISPVIVYLLLSPSQDIKHG
jgi:hypothetical protein